MSKTMELLHRLRSKPKPKPDWIKYGVGENELAQAFNLSSAVAAMLLDGLVATGSVRALDEPGNLIDVDECTIADLEGKAALVAGDELRDWISAHSTLPQGPGARDRVIAQKLREGINPPRAKSWKEFCDLIRNEWAKTAYLPSSPLYYLPKEKLKKDSGLSGLSGLSGPTK
jgi:hypothetical protein